MDSVSMELNQGVVCPPGFKNAPNLWQEKHSHFPRFSSLPSFPRSISAAVSCKRAAGHPCQPCPPGGGSRATSVRIQELSPGAALGDGGALGTRAAQFGDRLGSLGLESDQMLCLRPLAVAM